ncbi:MAG: tyrosine-type recombinase/integrase, partial [Verrucomicrobiae bacterium]|nr:tyrosine-type recombinase/integrase [Verrucomicrobiae bacterium]
MNTVKLVAGVRVSRGWPKEVSLGSVTVKIYRTTIQGAVIYQVADYSTGKRRLRSFADETEAVEAAARLARQLAAGDVQAAALAAADAAAYGRAVELLRPSGVPLEVAAATFADAVKALGGNRVMEAVRFYLRHRPDRMAPVPVAQAVHEYITTKAEKGRSPRHVADLRSRLGRFAGAFKVDTSSVTAPMLQRWLDALPVREQTRKNYRTVLHGFFAYCERRGYIAKGSNPAAETERPQVKPAETQIFRPGELARLLQHAPAAFVPALALGAFAGLRTAEILRLDWQDVDLGRGVIKVAAGKAKTGSRRVVPVLPALAAWLAPHARPSGPIWPGTGDQFYDAQVATAKAAGVKWKPNALRHSFISYRLADVQNVAQVALEAGNSAAVIFKHYHELVEAREAKAYFALRPEAPANIVPAPLTANAG